MFKLKFRDDVTNVIGHRKPTQSEIGFGYGAYFYKDFPVALWINAKGYSKTWIKCKQDGLRYYR